MSSGRWKSGFAFLMLASALPAQDTRWVTQVDDAYPSISPDGKQIVFQSTRLGRSDVFIADADGRNQRSLGGDGTRITPVWSPDGREIAFVASIDRQLDVFIMNADGGNVRRVTNDPGTDIHPHWSPDGKRIFFNSNRAPSADGRRVHNVFSASTSGADLRQHSSCRLDCTYPVPSPDGRRVVYRQDVDRPGFDWDLTRSSEDSEIIVADVDGGNEKNLSNNAAFDGWPMWSPNGRWIAFASNRTGPANVGQIYLIRPDGTGLRRITSGPWSHAQPKFSPDSRSLYVYKLQEGDDHHFGFIARVTLPGDVPT